MLQDTRRQQQSFDRESDKQDEGQSFQGSHPRRGGCKMGLVCICARWEMPNCSCFHLENERLLGLAGEPDVFADSRVRAGASVEPSV